MQVKFTVSLRIVVSPDPYKKPPDRPTASDIRETLNEFFMGSSLSDAIYSALESELDGWEVEECEVVE